MSTRKSLLTEAARVASTDPARAYDLVDQVHGKTAGRPQEVDPAKFTSLMKALAYEAKSAADPGSGLDDEDPFLSEPLYRMKRTVEYLGKALDLFGINTSALSKIQNQIQHEYRKRMDYESQDPGPDFLPGGGFGD